MEILLSIGFCSLYVTTISLWECQPSKIIGPDYMTTANIRGLTTWLVIRIWVFEFWQFLRQGVLWNGFRIAYIWYALDEVIPQLKVLIRRLSHALFNQNFCQYVPNFYRWEGVRSPTQMSQLLMSQSGYGGGGVCLIGTMSLSTFFFFFEGIPNHLFFLSSGMSLRNSGLEILL